ncbi:hypothetical protein KPK_0541 [Klebsiella variicola]|jgi:hypothetical protein|uniref:Uncharacterized protein n=1 Tax=Klebsiella variicola (strain 342) TaxID=507522 RepID=B5XSX0_KLEV3|nr:hypothetical protein KPK_0541 [Klebsiella variicola]
MFAPRRRPSAGFLFFVTRQRQKNRQDAFFPYRPTSKIVDYNSLN